MGWLAQLFRQSRLTFWAHTVLVVNDTRMKMFWSEKGDTCFDGCSLDYLKQSCFCPDVISRRARFMDQRGEHHLGGVVGDLGIRGCQGWMMGRWHWEKVYCSSKLGVDVNGVFDEISWWVLILIWFDWCWDFGEWIFRPWAKLQADMEWTIRVTSFPKSKKDAFQIEASGVTWKISDPRIIETHVKQKHGNNMGLFLKINGNQGNQQTWLGDSEITWAHPTRNTFAMFRMDILTSSPPKTVT